MRLRCDSDPAGAATPQIAPPTRAPAGRGPTDARHSRHARSRSHHGHRSATVTPESLQAAGKLPCATTLSSLDAAVVTRRRRRVTSFAFPSGGAPTGASLHLDRLPLQRRRPPGSRRRVRRLARDTQVWHRLISMFDGGARGRWVAGAAERWCVCMCVCRVCQAARRRRGRRRQRGRTSARGRRRSTASSRGRPVVDPEVEPRDD